MGNIFEPLEKAGANIDQFATKVETDIVESGQLLVTEGADIIKTAEVGVINVATDGLKTINNIQGNLLHSARFGAKNVVGLLDNQGDNVIQIMQDVRADVANTVQLFFIVGAVGAGIIVVLWGDKLFRSDIKLGKVSLF